MIVRTVRGFSLIEGLVAGALLLVVILIFFSLFQSGIFASDRGHVSAETREKARIGLDRIQTELRQATSVPSPTSTDIPSVILPGPGGQVFGNNEAAAVGCNVASGCVTGTASALNASIAVPAPCRDETGKPPCGGTIPGFLVFSELIQQTIGVGNPNYPLDPANYVWVMYQVRPPSGPAPSQLLRYTFPVVVGGTIRGVNGTANGWVRDDAYFALSNSNEGDGNGIPIVSLGNAKDQMWFMVSHPLLSVTEAQNTNMNYDFKLFSVSAVLRQSSLSNSQGVGLPALSATLSSQVKIEGGSP